MGIVSNNLFNRVKSQILNFAPRANRKAENIVVNHTTVRPIQRKSQDIQQWRMALMVAEQVSEQRQLLYDLYAEILLDGRLKRLVAQRTQQITNAKIAFTVHGKSMPAFDALVRTEAFNTFVAEALNARFQGISVLELYWQPPGSEARHVTNSINRKHIKPKRGIVTTNAYDLEGLPYREQPYTDFVIEVGKHDDLGELLECCPYVIYKRGGFGDWAEFAEVFGMPFRWATYNNAESRAVIEQALEQAGAAGYVVAPEDAKLQFLNATAGGSNNDIFKTLVSACNEELAIMVLGNSMTTTDSKNSGFAQANVHERTQEQVHADDRAYILRVLNEKLTPYLQRIGYPTDQGVWQFIDADQLSLVQRIDVDIKVATQVDIPARYWYEKYKIPAPEKGEAIGKGSPDPSQTPKGEPSKKDKPKKP